MLLQILMRKQFNIFGSCKKWLNFRCTALPAKFGPKIWWLLLGRFFQNVKSGKKRSQSWTNDFLLQWTSSKRTILWNLNCSLERESVWERESVRASEENHKLLDKKGRIMYKKYVETDSYTYHLGTWVKTDTKQGFGPIEIEKEREKMEWQSKQTR